MLTFWQVAKIDRNAAFDLHKKKKKEKMYLGKATQYQPDQFSDIGEGRVTSGVSYVFAADVQHRAQRHSTHCDIITHVEKQAVQVFPQLHRLHSKQDEDKLTHKQ